MLWGKGPILYVQIWWRGRSDNNRSGGGVLTITGLVEGSDNRRGLTITGLVEGSDNNRSGGGGLTITGLVEGSDNNRSGGGV